MPITMQPTMTAGETFANPFVGPINHTATVRVDVSALTTAEVDAYGYLKPGVPLQRSGLLIPLNATTPGAGTETLYGVTSESIKVAQGNTAADLAAAVDPLVAVALIGAVNRALIEDNLGRALHADELRAFNGAGSRVVLIY